MTGDNSGGRESAGIARSYFAKKSLEKGNGGSLEEYVSQHVYLMHLLNVMLKDTRIAMRVAFEKDDRGDSGLGIIPAKKWL